MATAPSFFSPIRWTNQDVTLYHGTLDRHVNAILTGGVNLTLGRMRTDFGRGFYTTTVERQAQAWAWQLSRRFPGSFPAVIGFDVNRNRLADLQCLWFVRGSFDAEDFWSFILHCRTGGSDHGRATNQGWYDVVIGPVAASWRQRLTIYDADQVSFHTPNGVNLLNTSNPRRMP
ncbi:DUF3990 domain-containing protein [Candidatus Entotheonella palauensis]|uniref:DUF3990 domain-containing protein n=1 Tax=Candidatus Entotheonella palauensis TaxID=93172 RepID=UPI000B7E8FED